MLTKEQLDNLIEMINKENELALLMCYINHNNDTYVKMVSNAEHLFTKYCRHLQDSFAQQTLNDVMLQRVVLQKEISKFVTMDFRDERVDLN